MEEMEVDGREDRDNRPIGRQNSPLMVQLSGRKLQATVAMKEAWEETRINRLSQPRPPQQLNDGGCCDSCCDTCCCCCCGPECRILIKYTVFRSLQLSLYVLDIATDISVAVADYMNGDLTFAVITLALVFTPGFLFVLFALTEMFYNNTGFLACFKASLWFLSFPLLPLWPIYRDLQKIYHGLMAACSVNQEEHLAYLNRPTRSYLLKFLEAFTEAAPQILLRLYRISLRRPELPFSQIETMEAVQVSFSLLSLSSTVISTYQKSISTQQIYDGELQDNERFRLPCCVQVLALLWWSSFLVARFEALALFAGSMHSWIFLVIGVHVVLVFLFQTAATTKHGLRRLFSYFFTGFVFVFAYLEYNVRSRIKVASWFPYTVYSVLVFIENSIMLVVWFSAQKALTTTLPEEDQAVYATHREQLIFIHYGTFCFALIMMVATFCCPERSDPEDKSSEDKEMRPMAILPS